MIMKKLIILGAFLSSLFNANAEVTDAYVHWEIMSKEPRLAMIGVINDYLSGTVKLPSVIIKDDVEYKVIWLDSFSNPDGLEINYSGVTNVILPDSIEMLGGVNNLYHMTSMPIPKTLRKIMPLGLSRNCALDSIGLPEGLLDIGKGAFEKCCSLSTVVLPSTVTHLTDCFEGCENLHTVVLGGFLRSIDADVFKTNTMLQNIYSLSECPPGYLRKGLSPGREMSPEVGKTRLYVPAESLGVYASCLESDDGEWDYTSQYELLPLPELFAVFSMECFRVEEGESIPLNYRLFNIADVEISEVRWQSSDPAAVKVENGIVRGLVSGETAGVSLIMTDSNGNVYTSGCRVRVVTNTGIETIESEQDSTLSDSSTSIYTLGGEFMGNSTEGLPFGVYIRRQGGTSEKIVIK